MLQPSIFQFQYMTIIQYFAKSHPTYLGNCECVTPQYILLTEGVISGSTCSSLYINCPSPLYSFISMSLLKIVIHIVFKLTIICDPTEYIIPLHCNFTVWHLISMLTYPCILSPQYIRALLYHPKNFSQPIYLSTLFFISKFHTFLNIILYMLI